MKIIIIGAGVAGLTLAIACQRAGFQVKVYDKASQLRNIGGGLLLWPHGIRYLEWLGLSDSLKPFRVPVEKCKIIGISGKEIFSDHYSDIYASLGGEIIPIDRSAFQQMLVAQLPQDVLELGKACVNVRQGFQQAHVEFADGTQDSADVVVGADGVYSAIREMINKDATPVYSNHFWWGGIVEQKHVPSLQPNEVYAALGHGKMCIVWPTQGDRFMWYLPVKISAMDLAEQTDKSLQLQKICEGWSGEIRQIISAPASTQNFQLPIFTLPPQLSWAQSRVTLIGDAAHALGPVLGQGANLAIEDAFVLANCLQNSPDNISDALRFFEAFRYSRIEKIFDLENQSSSSMVNDNLDELEAFEHILKDQDLVSIYGELIPLVNEKACCDIAEKVSLPIDYEA